MTKKVYRTAMGKTVDLGSLILQNEQVRAVGNMGVNAAGDVIDSSNRVIDRRNRQVQKQYNRQTSSAPPTAPAPRKVEPQEKQPVLDPEIDFETPAFSNTKLEEKVATNSKSADTVAGGLAGAMARSRSNKK